ncbi:MAG: endonuclease MutS2, partial [Acidobacteriota bacterium]
MDSSVCKTLEFDKIREVLETYADTPRGADRARSLSPSSDASKVRIGLKETSEARRLLAEGEPMPLAGTPDIRSHLQTLQVEHQALAAGSLLDLARQARISGRVHSHLEGRPAELRLLRELADELPDLIALQASIEKAIDRDTGEVKDDASPELRSLRARLFKLRNRLRSLLDSYLKQRDSRKILQEPLITERNGRAVLPVRSECRAQLVGIVHGTSASGATLFIEPLSTVEVNNDIVALEEEERQEVERILRSLTDEARSRRSELALASDILSRLDLIQAKALLSEAYDGSAPRLVEDKTLRLVSARHPLLLGTVAEKAGLPPPTQEAVPVSFQVGGERGALVFTGPNTGGKTVALKTAGLLSLMVQAGLHVPADPLSRFPVFKKVFADIGDEQSIGSSLSTFSAHLRKVVEMERSLEEPSLVILDEVGTGTDPAEGGALGTAL